MGRSGKLIYEYTNEENKRMDTNKEKSH
ncbi:MAG: hypothetical protein RL292_112, partial [Candidatus Parcubacteria bacterium]